VSGARMEDDIVTRIAIGTAVPTWRLVCVAAFLLLLGGCGGKAPDAMLEDAKIRREKGDAQGAVVQLKALLQETPDHAPARHLLGVVYNETADFRSAEKELRRALELKVAPSLVLPELARALFMQGEFKKVLDEVKVEDIADPKAAATILALRGNAHLALRQGAEARASLEKALAAKPDHAEALLGQARLAASEQQIDAAHALVEKALAADPKIADGWMLKGDLFRAQGKPAEAAAAYQKLVEFQADHVGAQLALASMEIADAKYDEAAKRLEEVRKRNPNNPMATYFRALIEFRRNNHQAARDLVQQVLKIAPNHLPSNVLAGAVEFALGSHEQAQARLRFVVERAPSNVYARRLLIASLSRTGQTQKAQELLDSTLKVAPNDAGVLALAGEVQMQLNEFAKAREYFEKAAAIDPKSSAMRTGLGLSRLASGETDRATADLESASLLDAGKTRADVLLISTHLQRRNFDLALKAAENLIKKQPENPLGHNLKAAAYIGKKDLPAARKSLEHALSLQPAYFPAIANLAQLDLQAGDPKAARKRFEDLIEKDRRNSQALLALAGLGSRVGATPAEIGGWLEAARKASPGAMQPLMMLTRFHLQSGDAKKALEVTEQALASAPESPEILDLAGQVQLAAGDRNRALATYGKLVTAQPQSPTALFKLAAAQLATENVSGAATTLRKAIGLRPDFAEAQVLLAELEVRSKRPQVALQIAQTLQKQHSSSPVGWVLEGDVLMADKKSVQAAKAYETAHGMAKGGTTLVKLHAALAQSGRGQDGEARLTEWLKQNANDLPVRVYLAEVYLKSSRYKAAIDQYEILQRAQPDNILVLNNLAWCYQQLKDKRAIETAEMAAKLRPDNPAVMDTLGLILVEMGDAKRGVELLAKATAGAPKSPEIRFNYARGLARVGDKAKARQELERLLVDTPDFSRKQEALALLADLGK
jgi:putative PEP-CTERM system TPR-repeat lipoprotein